MAGVVHVRGDGQSEVAGLFLHGRGGTDKDEFDAGGQAAAGGLERDLQPDAVDVAEGDADAGGAHGGPCRAQ